MNNISIMQPYLFPYIGYFQLIEAVDKFIFYDDVDFSKNKWIKRNKILINGESKYFTIPCRNVSSHKKINNIKHGLDSRKIKKLLKKIKFTYNQAPFFDRIYGLFREVLQNDTEYISEIAIDSVIKSVDYIGLECSFRKSSEKFENEDLSGADRLIDICKKEGINNYINPIGGRELYSKKYFKENKINLKFLKPGIKKYEQFGESFVPRLSIIDVMMFNSPEKIKNKLVKSYKLI